MFRSSDPAASGGDRRLDRGRYCGELARATPGNATPVAADRAEPAASLPGAGLPALAGAAVFRRAPAAALGDRSAHLPPGAVVRRVGARLGQSQNRRGPSTLTGPAALVRSGRPGADPCLP